MEFFQNLGEVALGGLVLYLGAEWLVKGASGMAKALGLKEIVIGLTVIAYATSAPELAVSVSANLSGSSAIVFGNVIGSCIANLALILGITAQDFLGVSLPGGAELKSYGAAGQALVLMVNLG